MEPRPVGGRCPHGTIRAHGGGLILAEKQTRADAEEPAEKLPELFDLHVMMFADRSDAIAVALQEAFAIDRVVAASLLADTPVVVKRAADPQVAAALLDVLQRLGAQVVLLPSTGPRVPQAPTGETPRSTASLWGGLDLAPVATPAPMHESDEHEQSLAAEADESEPDLEEDLSGASDEMPGLELDAPPEEHDRPLSEPAHASPPPTPPLLLDLGLGTVPPLPDAGAIVASSAPPLPVQASLPPAVPAHARGQAVAPPPPVPVSRGPATPSPSRNAAAAAKPAAKAAAQPRHRPDPGAPVMPELRLPELTPARSPSAARRDERSPEPADAEGYHERPVADAVSRPAASGPPASGRSRLLSLVEIVAGVLVLYLGVRMDNSVLYGNANYLSLAMHGLAIYGIGAGAVGLWP